MDQYETKLIEGKYNKEQIEFILSPVEDSKLIGIPGGGKSTCIQQFCKNKIDTGQLKSNEILILAFNSSSNKDLIKKLKNIVNKEKIKTFDKQVIDLNNHNNVPKINYNRDYNDEYYKKHNEVCISRLRKDGYNIDPIGDIKLIMIDESQDMNDLNYRLIISISKILKIPIILVGDTDQSINQFRGSDESFLENHKGNTIYLKINYRSNQSIINFAKYISEKKYDIIAGNGIYGEKPIYYKCDCENKAINNILNKIILLIREGIELNNMCIIVHTNDERKDLIKFFKSQNIEAVDTVKGLQIKTYHGAKGLEYHTVFLYGFKTHFGDNRNLKYVGSTRAKQKLYLYYIQEQRCISKKNIPYIHKKKECNILLNDIPREYYDTYVL